MSSKSRRVLTVACGTILVLASLVGGGVASAKGSATLAPRLALTCAWYSDIEWYFPEYYHDPHQNPITLNWDMQVQTYRNSTTGAYCGSVRDKVCVYLPSNFGWNSVSLDNEWFINGNFVNNIYQNFPEPPLPENLCSDPSNHGYGPSFSVRAGNKVEILGQLYFPDGQGQGHLKEDCCIG